MPNIQSPEHRIAAKFRRQDERLRSLEEGREPGDRIDVSRRFAETFSLGDATMTGNIDTDPAFRWDDSTSGGWDLSEAMY
ncbi:hypothetical protein [Halalkalicoccus sp. NIPERK01]|uniref:hypothetical protein n=1 Tax=Halalkalicoccus sp. NIPERK01 TaxID=3053469 RepID=UPI00256F1893|nr:hypothetical protein [Halalkalicoccus sp. NIPERK01]MDL5361343.1 hypothetical protein [Halalkalicoccus sp. NIPERK01]